MRVCSSATELAHRIKNTMAMISAIAGQTFRSVSSLEEAQAVFSARIAALGEAHSILTQSSGAGRPCARLIEERWRRIARRAGARSSSTGRR